MIFNNEVLNYYYTRVLYKRGRGVLPEEVQKTPIIITMHVHVIIILTFFFERELGSKIASIYTLPGFVVQQ